MWLGFLLLGCAASLSQAAEAPSFSGISSTRQVNVKTDFGARGDGVTDDTKAIQNAIDDIAARGGGTVYIPPGIYMVNTEADNKVSTLPMTRPGLPGPNGYTHQIWLRSNVRLLGAGGRSSVLKMPAGSRSDATDRMQRRNRAIAVIGDPTFSPQNLDRWQENIEIAYLGFDLDNGGARRAVQIRNPARNVRIHHCEGFQSDLEAGASPLDGLGKDNHFLNMASGGTPVVPAPTNRVDIPQNITIDNCTIKGLMQLTSDGGVGVRNLWIHHNRIENALSFGIAVTSTGAMDALFEDIKIEDNVIESPSGAGIFVGENYIDADMTFAPVALHAIRRVTIQRNTINLRSVPMPGVRGSNWAPNASGILVTGVLLETSDWSIQNNVMTSENAPVITTSRQALRISNWDFNWTQKWKRENGGAEPVLERANFDSTADTITMRGHNLINGLRVEFEPLTATALPAGLAAHRSYRVIKVDADRFALALPGSSTRINFGPAPASGRYLLKCAPSLERFTIAGNRITGVWDWDISIWGSSQDVAISGNTFGSRVVFEGTHDNLSYTGNNSTGVLALRDCTVRNGLFADNTWTIDENQSGRQPGPGIISITGPGDVWCHVDATFRNNTFALTAQTAERNRTFAALWMNRTDWRPPTWPAWPGSANLRLESNHITTPGTLRWSAEPQFVTRWVDNDGSNTLGVLTNRLPAPPLHDAEVVDVPQSGGGSPAPVVDSPQDGGDPIVGGGGSAGPESESVLAGLSVRSSVGSGDRTLIVGFVVTGSEPEDILVRGVGPGLAEFGVSRWARNPYITLYEGSMPIANNDNWSEVTDAQRVTTVGSTIGLNPLRVASLDSALYGTVAGGAYTVHCSDRDMTGVALVEIYDAKQTAGARLVCVSARAYVGAGEDVLIAGFTVSGTKPKRLLLRGVGPTLKQYGVTDALAQPTIELHRFVDGQDTVLGFNGGWGGTRELADAFARTGAFALPADSQDAALLVTLNPGNYTVHVADENQNSGVGLVEVYEVLGTD